MPFIQIIEYKTNRIDELNTALDGWLEATKGQRAATRGVQTKDRDATNTYICALGGCGAAVMDRVMTLQTGRLELADRRIRQPSAPPAPAVRWGPAGRPGLVRRRDPALRSAPSGST